MSVPWYFTTYLKNKGKQQYILEGMYDFARKSSSTFRSQPAIVIISQGGTMLALFTVPLENIPLFTRIPLY
jgi:hypothetical protein